MDGANSPRPPECHDPKARRVVIDPDTGQRVITYKARKSFIRDFAAPVRHVLRLMDPVKGVVLMGPAFPRVPGR
jgi:hypothetical protein